MTDPRTKLETIRYLISRKRGASMDELINATGWLKGSVTGNIGKLRRRGITVSIEHSEKRGTVYRATEAPEITGS